MNTEVNPAENAEVDRPLSDLVVVELCTGRAGSVAGMLLADLGADVARIEAASGSNRRPSPFEHADPVCWDRDKRTVMVDTLDPVADPLLASALHGADVLLLDAPPATVIGSPLDPARLGTAFPRLVVVWLAPHGTKGDRFQDLPADPLLISAITTYAMYQPARDPSVPIAPVIPVVEYEQGALGACAAVAGVLERRRGGLGQLATISSVDAAGALLATLVNDSLDVPKAVRSERDAEGGPNFRRFRCSDGEVLFMAALTPSLFFRALDVLDAWDVMLIEGVDGEFLNLFEPSRGRLAASMLEARFLEQPRRHWLDRLEAAGVPVEPAQSRDQWLVSEQFARAVGRRRFEHPLAGPVDTPAHPSRLTERGAPGEPSTLWPGNGRTSGAGPLSGLRVVDLAMFLAAPFASTLFAFWGAEVVKLEPPDGDPYGVYTISYLAVNQAKRSAVVDVRSAEGRRQFEAIAGAADVLIDNLRPSVRAALELGDDALAAVNPHLIHGRLGAFHEDEERPGFDPSIQAVSGMMVAAGAPGEPLNTTTPSHDVAAGTVIALGVLAGLWQRAERGHAVKVSSSLAAASALLQCAELTDFTGRPPRAQGGVDFVGGSAAQRFYRAAGGWFGLTARSSDELRAALEALAAPVPPELDADPAGPVAAAIEAAVADRAVGEVVAALQAAGVPAAPVTADWATDPHLVANELSHVVIEPRFGRCRVMRGPGTWSRSGVVAATRMVERGADTQRLVDGDWSPSQPT